LREGQGQLAEEAAVGSQGNVQPWSQPGYASDHLWQVFPQQWLATGQTDTANSTADRRVNHGRDLVK
jgi:hypothetical protein